MDETIVNYMGILAALIFYILSFFAGIIWAKDRILRKQIKCEHNFKLLRVCTKCGLMQKEVKE